MHRWITDTLLLVHKRGPWRLRTPTNGSYIYSNQIGIDIALSDLPLPPTSASMKRILIYSHDTFGLGNLRRMSAIARHLADAGLSVLMLSGSPLLQAIPLNERIDYVKLPSLARTSDGNYAVKSLPIDYEQVLSLRANLILHAVLDFKPDLVLVDKKPLGVSEELELMLDVVGGRLGRPKFVLVLRDILDAEEPTIEQWTKHQYHRIIGKHYDCVLILGTKEVFDPCKAYKFPQQTAKLTHFCGYLRFHRDAQCGRGVRAKLGLKQERLVLVTAGGGEDGFSLCSSYLRGLAGNSLLKNVHSLIVCGPAMSTAHRTSLMQLAAHIPTVTLRHSTQEMYSCMEAADVIVSMAGYNTLCEVLTLNKPAVVVPRFEPVQEQLIRATRMAERGWVRLVDPRALASEQLIGEIASALNGAKNALTDCVDLGGLSNVQSHVMSLLDLEERSEPVS